MLVILESKGGKVRCLGGAVTAGVSALFVGTLSRSKPGCAGWDPASYSPCTVLNGPSLQQWQSHDGNVMKFEASQPSNATEPHPLTGSLHA